VQRWDCRHRRSRREQRRGRKGHHQPPAAYPYRPHRTNLSPPVFNGTSASPPAMMARLYPVFAGRHCPPRVIGVGLGSGARHVVVGLTAAPDDSCSSGSVVGLDELAEVAC
jgi:hypothetical protein